MNSKKFYQISSKEVIKRLNSSFNGLTSAEARKLLKTNGENTLPRKKEKGLIALFFSQFINPITYILLVAMVVSFALNEKVDALFILLVILTDSILGTIQEWKAIKDAAGLQNLLKMKSIVIRDGKEKEIDASHLVLGDIVKIESGNKVAADIRLIETINLSVDESFLTGESIAVIKSSDVIEQDVPIGDAINLCFAGSTVTSGRGMGIVIATGIDTEIGKIAKNVVESKEEKSPLTIRMEKFTKQISYIIVFVAIILSTILYFKGYSYTEIFFSVVALSVSCIPEGLSVVLTVALSISSSRMASKNVIVKKLNSVESLGSCTVIASDKTGTLTVNEQTAKIIVLPDNKTFKVSGVGYNDNGEVMIDEIEYTNQLQTLINMGYINNEAVLEKEKGKWVHKGDAIDIAFLSLSTKLGGSRNNKKIVGRIPYESDNKYSAVFFKEEEQYFVTVKGAPEVIVNFCSSINSKGEKEKIDKKKILKICENTAKKGYRIIAIAGGELKSFEKKNRYEIENNNMTLLGLVGFIDPVREEAIESIKECHEAGIKVVMITGDHPLTSCVIAKELGIVENEDQITSGIELGDVYQLGEEEFDKFVASKYVFARVTPIQKLQIVESYKRQKEFVAVTGDGVNDAPAIKAANIGIAMGSGSDITKDSCTMIIKDDNFKSIVAGVEEGRFAYDNIRKVTYLLISCGVGELLFFILAVIFNFPIPLLAIQLLWLNLVTEGIQDIFLAFEKGEMGVMKKHPRKPDENIFDKLLISETVVSGFAIGLLVFGLWAILLNSGMEVNHARGYVLFFMVFIQNVHVFNCRSESTSVFKIPFKNNKKIVIGVIMAIGLQIIVSEVDFFSNILGVYTLDYRLVLITMALSLIVLFVMEIFKIFIRRKQK